MHRERRRSKDGKGLEKYMVIKAGLELWRRGPSFPSSSILRTNTYLSPTPPPSFPLSTETVGGAE